MKIRIFAIVFAVAVIAMGSSLAQEAPKASLHLFSDQFGGADGAVFYPQYAWHVKVPTGTASGYGFGEVAPYEEFFTNHLVILTPDKAPWFSVHAEIGGKPNLGLSFVQIGPRINLTSAIPWLARPMDHAFFTALPRWEGIRPNNALLAGATNRFKVTNNLQASIEGYRRFFPHGGYYGEYWLLAHPKKTPHLSPGIFILNDSSSTTSVGLGMRLSLF